MSNPRKFVLAGAINPTRVGIGFCIPIFQSGSDLYVQDRESSFGYQPINERMEAVIPFGGEPQEWPSGETLYAFLGVGGDVYYDYKAGMQNFLRSQIARLGDHVFIKLEVLGFIEDTDSISKAVEEATLLIEAINPSGAKVWARMQQRRSAQLATIERKYDGRIGRESLFHSTIRKIAAGFEELSSENLNSIDFSRCYVEPDDWHMNHLQNSMVFGRKGSGKSSLLRAANELAGCGDLVRVKPDILTAATEIDSRINECMGYTPFHEKLWGAVISGVICQNAVDRSDWSEFISSHELRPLVAAPEESLILYSAAPVIEAIAPANPVVATLMSSALAVPGANFPDPHILDLMRSHSSFSPSSPGFIIDGLDSIPAGSASPNQMRGLHDCLRRFNRMISGSTIMVAMSSSHFFEYPQFFGLASRSFKISWSRRQMRQLVIERIGCMVQKESSKDAYADVLSALGIGSSEPEYDGLDYVMGLTQMTPRQVLLIMRNLLNSRISTLQASPPSKSDIHLAFSQCAPMLARESAREITRYPDEFLYAVACFSSAVGHTFSSLDVKRTWEQERSIGTFFSSPEKLFEDLARVEAIGRVVREPHGSLRQHYAISAADFHESSALFCIHPLFQENAFRKGRSSQVLSDTQFE